MKKSTLWILVLSMLLVTLTACSSAAITTAATTTNPNSGTTTSAKSGSDSDYDKQDKITFGVTAQITGKNALTGEYIVRGATLAAEELNAKGGVLGKQVELIFEDEGDDQQTAINACQKLLARDYISGFYGGLTSSYSVAMIPYVNKASIPFMAGGSSSSIAKQKSEYTWQPRLVDVYSSAALANAYVNALKLKKPGILYVNESFGISNYEGIVKTLKEHNIEPAISLSYNAGETQYSNMLTQIINSGADGLIAITTMPMDAATIMAQTYDMKFPLPCLGSNGFATSAARSTAKEKSNGWYNITDYTPDNNYESGLKFEKAYKEKWGTIGDLGAVGGYDSIMLLAEAAKIAGSADPAAINAALPKIKDFKGATSDMTCDPEWKCFAQWLVLCQNENDGGTCKMIDLIKK